MTIKLSQLVAADTPLVGDELLEVVQGGVSKQVAASALGMGGGRILLTADTTYYVATTGDDSTGDGSVGNPWLTIQKAVDHVCGVIDLIFYNVTIQIADGTYTTPVILKPRVGAGDVTIQGNAANSSAVVLSITSANAITNLSAGKWLIQHLKVLTITSGGAVYAAYSAIVDLNNIDFGACVGSHVDARFGATIRFTGDYSISGGSATGGHWATINGTVTASNRTVTITGTPSFPVFAWGNRGLGLIDCFSMTFTGTATGPRYILQGNSVCFTNGGGATYLPGNVAGSVATGAIYA